MRKLWQHGHYTKDSSEAGSYDSADSSDFLFRVLDIRHFSPEALYTQRAITVEGAVPIRDVNGGRRMYIHNQFSLP